MTESRRSLLIEIERIRDQGWTEETLDALIAHAEDEAMLGGVSLVIGDHPKLWAAWAQRDAVDVYLRLLDARQRAHEPSSAVAQWVRAAQNRMQAPDDAIDSVTSALLDIPMLAPEALIALSPDRQTWRGLAHDAGAAARKAAIQAALRAAATDSAIAARALRCIAACGGWPIVGTMAPEETARAIRAALATSDGVLTILRAGVITIEGIVAATHHAERIESALTAIGEHWATLTEQERHATRHTAARSRSSALALTRIIGHDPALMRVALGPAPNEQAITDYAHAVAAASPSAAMIEALANDLPQITSECGVLLGGHARFWYELLRTGGVDRVLRGVRSACEGGWTKWREHRETLARLIASRPNVAAEAMRFFGPDPVLLRSIESAPETWSDAIRALEGWAQCAETPDANDQAMRMIQSLVDRALQRPVGEAATAATLLEGARLVSLPDYAIERLLDHAKDRSAMALTLMRRLRPFWDRLEPETRNRLMIVAIASFASVPSVIEVVGLHPPILNAMREFASRSRSLRAFDWVPAYAQALSALDAGGDWERLDHAPRMALLHPLLESGVGIGAALAAVGDDPIILGAIRSWPHHIAAPVSLWTTEAVRRYGAHVPPDVQQAITAVTPPSMTLVLATGALLGRSPHMDALCETLRIPLTRYANAIGRSPMFWVGMQDEPPNPIALEVRRSAVLSHGATALEILENAGIERDLVIGFAAGHPTLAAACLIRHPDVVHDPLALAVLLLSVNDLPSFPIAAMDDHARQRWERMIGVTDHGILSAMQMTACPEALACALPPRAIMEATRRSLPHSIMTDMVWQSRLSDDPVALLNYAQAFGAQPWIEGTIRTRYPAMIDEYRRIILLYGRDSSTEKTGASDADSPLEQMRALFRKRP